MILQINAKRTTFWNCLESRELFEISLENRVSKIHDLEMLKVSLDLPRNKR